MTAEPPAVMAPALTVEDLLISAGYLRATTSLTWFRRALLVGEEARNIVQEMTAGQRDSPLWCQLRKLRLTASNFGVVLSAVGRNKLNQNRYAQCTIIKIGVYIFYLH